MDESDPTQIHCRFSHVLFRDALYQILLHKAVKKDLHDKVINLAQSAPVFRDHRANEKIALMLKEHMLTAAGVQTEEELPHNRRTGLNVRRIQNLLAKDSDRL